MEKKALIELELKFEKLHGVSHCVLCEEAIYGIVYAPFVYVNEKKKNKAEGLDLCESCYYEFKNQR